MQCQHINLWQQLVQSQAIGSCILSATFGQQHVHTEGFSDFGHRPAQITVADNADAFAGKLT